MLSDLDPIMTFLHLPIRLPVLACKAVLFRQSKGRFDLIIQVPLIVFERQGILPVLVNDLLSNFELRSHRINGDDAAIERSLP